MYQLLFLLVFGVNGYEWNSVTYPNPEVEFQVCQMKAPTSICDPDGILVKMARQRLDKELKLLEIKTRPRLQTAFAKPDSCDSKGVTVIVALAERITETTATEMAQELLDTWNLDEKCRKGVVLVISASDKQWGVARGEKTPLDAEDFYDIFRDQKRLLQQTDYPVVLTNVLQRIEEKSHQWDRPRSIRGTFKTQNKIITPTKIPLWLTLGFWLILFACIVVLSMLCFLLFDGNIQLSH